MNTVWVLVCDTSRARIFEVQEGEPEWKVVDVLGHVESRSKASALVSDHSGQRSPKGPSAAGQNAGQHGSSHHNALAPASDPKDVEKGRFVHTLGTKLDEAMRNRLFRRWVLVAPPHALGMVKAELTPELEKHLMTTVDKDLTHFDVAQLVDRLHDAIRIPPDQREVVREPNKHAH